MNYEKTNIRSSAFEASNVGTFHCYVSTRAARNHSSLLLTKQLLTVPLATDAKGSNKGPRNFGRNEEQIGPEHVPLNGPQWRLLICPLADCYLKKWYLSSRYFSP